MEVDRLGSRDPPLLFALAGVIIAESLQNQEKEHLKKKKSFKRKGKKKKKEGKKRKKKKEQALCSNGSYAKKQLTKNRQSREEKWGKNKMVWSQADKCARKIHMASEQFLASVSEIYACV